MRLETTLALAMMPLATLAVTMWAMHLAAGADALRDVCGDGILNCAALSFLAMSAIGESIRLIRFDSIRLIRFDSIRWGGKCRSSLKCVSTFLYNRRVLQLLPLKKEKKSPAAAVGFRPANLTARQFLQYIR